ncbi:endonuclease NucS [Mobiluncus mulieris]|uniref:Endonuclease NucS n=1 Tax=Mobiluncus mulieris TaxID=2052 RepID=A0A7Y0USP0_9ACTO|nr:endonuclease NucS [Mobiluncus mulieris]MCU9972020.1 endonuclease NucS [Mobiluncus mulieris]NMW91896.1 endonuclease NucS [Mobiluncus mulieris]NMX03016.1 endonuclease NucS [Mobiluncus mulieris]
MRLVIADCEVNYSGRLDAHLAPARRLIMVKADGSVLIHCDGGSYKPLNWMSAPCRLEVIRGGTPVHEVPSRETDVTGIAPHENAAGAADSQRDDPAAGSTETGDGAQTWRVTTKKNETLVIEISRVYSDETFGLGIDPGLEKDGVEKHLQALLAEQVEAVLGKDWRLVRREWPTPIGPVDLLVRDPEGHPVAIEVKRRGEIDGVEQLTRYLELLGRQPELAGLTGIFAAQEIKAQARTLAEDRGIRCVLLDYDALRGMDDCINRLF